MVRVPQAQAPRARAPLGHILRSKFVVELGLTVLFFTLISDYFTLIF